MYSIIRAMLLDKLYYFINSGQMCLQATPVGPPAKSSSVTCSLRRVLHRTTQGKVNPKKIAERYRAAKDGSTGMANLEQNDL